jgi:hypothetical protein
MLQSRGHLELRKGVSHEKSCLFKVKFVKVKSMKVKFVNVTFAWKRLQVNR